MTPERRQIVNQIREEGRQAAHSNKHVQTNPYPTYSSNHDQWLRGYSYGELEKTSEEEQ